MSGTSASDDGAATGSVIGPSAVARVHALAAMTKSPATAHPTARTARLERWESAPSARAAHPSEDHLVPLMVAVGAAEHEPAARTYYENEFAGSITASSYRFGT